MTYQEALNAQAALEAALLSGASRTEIAVGDKRVRYQTTEDIRAALAEVNRSICRYNRRTRGASQPGVGTPVFTWHG